MPPSSNVLPLVSFIEKSQGTSGPMRTMRCALYTEMTTGILSYYSPIVLCTAAMSCLVAVPLVRCVPVAAEHPRCSDVGAAGIPGGAAGSLTSVKVAPGSCGAEVPSYFGTSVFCRWSPEFGLLL